MPKVLFICKKRVDSYGTSFGLLNSATFVSNALVAAGIESKCVCVLDNNCIDREVSAYKPTHVMIEAIWVVPSKFETLIKLHPGVEWVVRVHSKSPFLSMEGIAMDWICQYDELGRRLGRLHVSPNSESLHEDLMTALEMKTIYLPNIYSPTPAPIPRTPCRIGVVDIGCFGAIRPMKNHLIQAMAAMAFANEGRVKLRFHINQNRVEQRGEEVLKNLRMLFQGTTHELVEHKWVPHSEFIEIIRTMDLGMQVSLSESFNIVAADFVANGVPVVGSSDIDWLPWPYKANPNSSRDIANRLWWAWVLRPLGVQTICRLALASYNRKATRAWMSYLKD